MNYWKSQRRAYERGHRETLHLARVLSDVPEGLSEADYRNLLARRGISDTQIDNCWRNEQQRRKAAA